MFLDPSGWRVRGALVEVQPEVEGAGVIHMAMTQDNHFYVFNVQAQLFHVVENPDFCVSRVKKDGMFFFSLPNRDEQRKAMFGQKSIGFNFAVYG